MDIIPINEIWRKFYNDIVIDESHMKFKYVIRYLSEDKNFNVFDTLPIPNKEWSKIDYYSINSLTGKQLRNILYDHCICGKFTSDLLQIKNYINSNVLSVCNDCFEKYINIKLLDYKKIIEINQYIDNESFDYEIYENNQIDNEIGENNQIEINENVIDEIEIDEINEINHNENDQINNQTVINDQPLKMKTKHVKMVNCRTCGTLTIRKRSRSCNNCFNEYHKNKYNYKNNLKK